MIWTYVPRWTSRKNIVLTFFRMMILEIREFRRRNKRPEVGHDTIDDEEKD